MPIEPRKKLTAFYKCAFPCAAAFLLIAWQPLRNDWVLRRLHQNITALQHPPGSAHHHFINDIGNLSGTGNQIDYFSGEVRSYTGSKAAVSAFYANRTIWNPASRKNVSLQIVFTDDNSEETQSLTWSASLNQWPVFPAGRKNFYMVYIFDGGYDPGTDIRGY